jgi:hypothetical protein
MVLQFDMCIQHKGINKSNSLIVTEKQSPVWPVNPKVHNCNVAFIIYPADFVSGNFITAY